MSTIVNKAFNLLMWMAVSFIVIFSYTFLYVYSKSVEDACAKGAGAKVFSYHFLGRDLQTIVYCTEKTKYNDPTSEFFIKPLKPGQVRL